ncbi:MAG: YabP/YqfC family sporulation protein [Bacillota bacterium]|nr:YabP/YqfC family sporulation protein [Bacillota bacterium]
MAKGKKKAGLITRGLGKVARRLDIPVSSVTRTARISIDGNCHLILEGHEGISEYTDELIRINCKNMVVSGEGNGLSMKAMNTDGLSLTGSITKIEFSV